VYLQFKYLAPGTQTPSDFGVFHGAYTLSSLPFTVTQPTCPQINIVVPTRNVAISMKDIFASFANIHLKHISPTKNYFFPFRQECYDMFSFNLK
jgi:hypothetical protein